MNAEFFQIVSVIAFTMAIIFLVLAIILFFKLDIPAVIGELSGKTAAKQVAEIREQARIQSLKRRPVSEYRESDEVTLQTSTLQNTKIQMSEEQTVLLTEETMLLGETEELKTTDGFHIVMDVVMIHTDKRI